jgi:hypothetical protein
MRKLGIPADKFSRLRRNRSRALAALPERDANDEQFQITGSAPVFSEGVV